MSSLQVCAEIPRGQGTEQRQPKEGGKEMWDSAGAVFVHQGVERAPQICKEQMQIFPQARKHLNNRLAAARDKQDEETEKKAEEEASEKAGEGSKKRIWPRV